MTTDRPTPETALEPIHVVLPMRTVSGGKARLGEVIDAEEREELVLGMLLHTLSVLGDWRECRRIISSALTRCRARPRARPEWTSPSTASRARA